MRTSPRADWLTLAVLGWAGLAIGFAVLAFFYPHAHTVYPIYAPAPRRWWQGLDIYVCLIDYYRYSPLCAILLTPFAALPDCWGGALWKAFNVGVYGAGLLAAARHLFPVRLTRNQTGALLLLALPLSFHSMYNGQANLVMVGTMLLGLSAAARGRWSRAACWLALSTLVKSYPVALGLLLSGLHPRKFAPRFAGFLALGLLLPFATQPPATVAEQYASWFTHLRQSTSLMRERQRSFDYLLERYGAPISPMTFTLLGVLAGAAALGVSLRWARRTLEARPLLTRVFLLFAAWAVLFGPATEACSYVIIAPAIAWALVEAWHQRAGRGRLAVLAASLFLMGPSVTDLVGQTLRHLAWERAAQPLGALLFLGHLLTWTPANRGAAEPAAPELPRRCAA